MAEPTPPRAMSSRLLTMKFMQRAAASSLTSPTSPESHEQSSKRQKVSHSSSTKASVESQVDQQAIQAAIDEGERKRQTALVKHAAELGDARWVLNVQEKIPAQVKKPLNVIQVGLAQIDSSDASGNFIGSSEARVQPFLRFNMAKKKVPAAASDADGDTSSDSDSSDASDSSEDGPGRRSYGLGSRTPSRGESSSTSRNGLPKKRSAEKAKAREFANKRRKKELNLNTSSSRSAAGLTSISARGISSGGGISAGGGFFSQDQSRPLPPSFKCASCGVPGHRAVNCPKKTRR